MTVLVTGGAGYIGSHTCVAMLEKGYDVIIVDNLCNSKREAVDTIEKLAEKKVKFYENDLTDAKACDRIFEENKIDAVIHFAGLKAVGESVQMPLTYYKNNILSTLNLCESMKKYGCKQLVFSSSATVYGTPKTVPIKEDFPLSTTNPYGSTKLMIENILRDFYVSDNSFIITLLRYFNPIGAHDSAMLGENPNGIPNNLMPYITRVAKGKLECLSIFGNDYPTHDGTGVRDYIHVMDLADGHVKAIEGNTKPGVYTYNLGTGNGYSVLDIVKAFEKVNGVKVNYKITDRRPGDIAECYADPSLAKKELGWAAKRGVEEMCRSAWEFEKKNG